MRSQVSCRIRFNSFISGIRRREPTSQRVSGSTLLTLPPYFISPSPSSYSELQYVSAVTFCHQSIVNCCLPADVKPAALKYLSRDTRN
ncbi:MAG: hypothetical protein QOC89_3107, partial [Paraburkholderia sp.]|nr:hypothetical protein [Paraburkholderia sp.]